MDKLIYTYALIKSLYDQGEDYVDSFWPFAVKAFPAHRFVDYGFIQRNLKEIFDLEVPLHVLGNILNRAKERDYIEQKKKEKVFKLTSSGINYLDKLETDKEVDRRMNALLEDMIQFFSKQNVSLTLEQIKILLLSFIRINIDPLIEFINPSASPIEHILPKFEGYENLLIEYIRDVDQHKPENYKTLQDMILGSIISAILYAKEPSEMTEIKKRKFKHCQVFFDTNFIFSLLDLHPPEFSRPAKELFDLLKKYGFDLKVFSFTVNEICKVVNAYLTQAHRYPATIGVDTLYSSLNEQGWTKTRAREFVANIESILQENGIEIEWEEDIDLNIYCPKNEGLRNLIRECKPLQSNYHQNHDLAAIEKIEELRGKPIRKIEDSKVFFLTSDIRLSRLNFTKMGHKENGTVCEAILDRLLTNILWLKDPCIEPPLKSIIAAYSRDLFIKSRIWDKFYEALQQLWQERKVDDENISTLFYHGYIEDVLKDIDEQEADKITPGFALEEIEKAAKFKEKSLEKQIKEKEQEFLRQLKEAVSKKELEKEEEWFERIKVIKSNLRESAEKKASKESKIYASLLTLLALGITYGIYLGFKKLGIANLFALIIPLLFGGSGILGLWTKLRSNLKSRLTESKYMQKLKEAKLDKEKKD